MQKKIIHIDMDAFFASVEQRENPELVGKPIAVGGRADQRGVIATASYAARKFGVRSALPTHKAFLLCPDLILIAPNFALYRKISMQIREIFLDYTPLVEPLSIDEAYLDVSGSELHQGSATRIAADILKDIEQQTHLTASAGVSYNKFLAKYASNMNKPAGIYTIKPEDAVAIICNLPIQKFHGIGPATTQKLNQIGVYSGGDLKKIGLKTLTEHLGRRAQFYYDLANGVDLREVKSEKPIKSIGKEETFAKDISNIQQIEKEMIILLNSLFRQLEGKNLHAKTITLKLKYANFKIQNKSYSERGTVIDLATATLICKALLQKTEIPCPVRLIGVSFSHLSNKSAKMPIQLRLFD